MTRKWLNAGVMERHRCRDAAGRDCQPLRTCFCTTCLIRGFTGHGVRGLRAVKRSLSGTISWSGFSTSGMRSNTFAMFGRGRFGLDLHPDNRRVRPVRYGEPPEARAGRSTSRASGTSARGPGQGASGSVAKRVARTRIEEVLRKRWHHDIWEVGGSVKAGSTTSPSLAVHVPPKAATPVDAGDTPPLPTPPFQLEATGAHDRTSLAAHPLSMAGPAVCRQVPEAGWTGAQVRICAGGAQQCAFLPRRNGQGAARSGLVPWQVVRRSKRRSPALKSVRA